MCACVWVWCKHESECANVCQFSCSSRNFLITPEISKPAPKTTGGKSVPVRWTRCINSCTSNSGRHGLGTLYSILCCAPVTPLPGLRNLLSNTHALVIFHMAYCNVLCMEVLLKSIWKLQLVENVVTQVVLSASRGHM